MAEPKKNLQLLSSLAGWAIVTAGCCAALTHTTSACIAGTNPERPQRPEYSRNVCHQAIRMVGVKIVTVHSPLRTPKRPSDQTCHHTVLDPYVLKTLIHDIAESTAEHIVLVAVSSSIAVVIGVGLGILGTRHKALRNVSISVANVLQTIPSLALFGFLLPIPFIGGIGKHTAILCLVLYSLLPILRNTVVGISGVDAPLREAAVAMGMTDRQLLQMVELPLAAPTILAGVRIALVTNIGTAVIAAIIGGGGLGVLIFRGVESLDTLLILAGAVPAALMALIADGAMSYLEKKVAVR